MIGVCAVCETTHEITKVSQYAERGLIITVYRCNVTGQEWENWKDKATGKETLWIKDSGTPSK